MMTRWWICFVICVMSFGLLASSLSNKTKESESVVEVGKASEDRCKEKYCMAYDNDITDSGQCSHGSPNYQKYRAGYCFVHSDAIFDIPACKGRQQEFIKCD